MLAGLALGCDEPELGEAPCDTFCADAGFGDIDENADGEGNWSCECKGSGNSLDETGCRQYCDDVAGEKSTATLEGKTCSCVEAA